MTTLDRIQLDAFDALTSEEQIKLLDDNIMTEEDERNIREQAYPTY